MHVFKFHKIFYYCQISFFTSITVDCVNINLNVYLIFTSFSFSFLKFITLILLNKSFNVFINLFIALIMFLFSFFNN